MRLLHTTSDGRLRTETFNGTNIPPYAILSHTWKEGQEVTFADLKELDNTEDTIVQSDQFHVPMVSECQKVLCLSFRRRQRMVRWLSGRAGSTAEAGPSRNFSLPTL